MGRGRPHSLETKLGVMIKQRDTNVYTVAGQAQIAPRIMTEYLAGRRRIRDDHLANLSRVLECEPDEISGDSQEDPVPTTRPNISDAAIRHLKAQQKRLIRREAN